LFNFSGPTTATSVLGVINVFSATASTANKQHINNAGRSNYEITSRSKGVVNIATRN
jgi:hypothetical protein